jgi:LuxR family maltose regulon positive regulatory protein
LDAQGVLLPGHVAAVFCEDIAALSICMELVLDDYHEIHDSAVNAFVQSVLRCMPANLRLLILTRKRLPFSVARLRSQNQLAEIIVQDLQLSVEESDTLLRSMVSESLLPETLTAIHQQTEGWAAGIRLIGLALRDRLDEVALRNLLQRGQSIRYISDYLMDEVLAQQTDDIQTFLLHTSLLEELDAASCAAVLDDAEGVNSAARLDYVVSTGLFLVSPAPLESSAVEGAYRYHTIFRRMLQDRLRTRLHTSEIAAIHRRIAAHMAKVGAIDLALESWRMADAPDLAAAQIETLALSLIDAEAWSTLERYLAYLPETLIEDRPLLLLAKIWICNMLGEFQRMGQLIERLGALLSSTVEESEERQRVQLRAALALTRLNLQQFSGSLPTLADAAALESAAGVFPANSYMGTLSTTLLAWICSINGEYARGRGLVASAIQATGMRPGLAVLRLMHGLLVNTLAIGRIDDLTADLPLYYDLAAEAGHPVHLIWANALLCYVAYLQGEDDRVVPHAHAVLEMVHIAPFVSLALALWLSARSIRTETEAQWVQEQLTAARKHARLCRNDMILATCNAIEARLRVSTGKVEQGVRWALLLIDPERSLMLPLPIVQLCWLYCMARAHAAADLLWAQQVAERLMVLYRSLNSYPLQRIELGLLLVRIYQMQGSQQAAFNLLADLVQEAMPFGFICPFVEAGASLQPMLQQLAKRPKLASFVALILDRRAPSAPLAVKPPLDLAAQAAYRSLTQREQDILMLLAQGMTNPDIAQAMSLSPYTVRNHLVNIYDKLGVSNRQGAAAWVHFRLEANRTPAG